MPKAAKITLAEMQAAGVRGVLVYCFDYHCSHWTKLSADSWPDHARLPDIEGAFACMASAIAAPTFGRIGRQ